jgi:serine/threonine protein kinase
MELARRLATAVFFVHSVGWVHKAIRPENILIFQKTSRGQAQEGGKQAASDHSSSPRWSLGSACLVGFDAGRDDLAETDPGARNQNSLVDEIYTHPDRQASAQYHTRHTMSHDIYSLGVVLTEIGIWTPLENKVSLGHGNKAPQIQDILANLARETALMMGEKYARLVQMCLRQGDQESGNEGNRRIMAVLEKLEDLAMSL